MCMSANYMSVYLTAGATLVYGGELGLVTPVLRCSLFLHSSLYLTVPSPVVAQKATSLYIAHVQILHMSLSNLYTYVLLVLQGHGDRRKKSIIDYLY